MKDVFINIGQNIVAPIIFGIMYAVSAFVSQWYKNLKAKRGYSTEAIMTGYCRHEKIQDILAEIRVKYDADRCFLSMFHNGDKYLEGSQILKKTRTNESVGPGISSPLIKYKDIHITSVPEEMKAVINDKASLIHTQDIADSVFKRYLLSDGVRDTIRCGIRKNGNLIGFIGVDYVGDNVIGDVKMEDFIIYTGLIEQILSSVKN